MLGVWRIKLFSTKKKEFVLIRRHRAIGPDFRLLGIEFDPPLLMHKGVRKIATEAGWRVSALLRPRKFFKVPELMRLYKAHVLSFVESGFIGYFHASDSVLSCLDSVQRRFLRELNLSDEEALLRFRLAPLRLRREIGILGFLHRINLRQTSAQIAELFPRIGRRATPMYNFRAQFHDKQLLDRVDNYSSSVFRRSIFGMVSCYNALPQQFVEATTVKAFQNQLQKAVTRRVLDKYDGWREIFSVGRRYSSVSQFQWFF